MLEKILKTVLTVALMALFIQRVVFPVVMDAQEKGHELDRMRTSLQRMATDERQRTLRTLEMEEQMTKSHLEQINSLLPEFEVSRSKALRKIEDLRLEYPGEWDIKPQSGRIRRDDTIVRWPISLTYKGEFITAMKMLEKLESELSLNRFSQIYIKSESDNTVVIEANFEMIFRS